MPVSAMPMRVRPWKPAVKETMARQGNTINISTPAEAAAAFRSELQKYATLAKKVGLEAK